MDEVREGQHSNNQSALRNTKSRQRPHYVTKITEITTPLSACFGKNYKNSRLYFYFRRVDYVLRLWIARPSKGAMVLACRYI